MTQVVVDASAMAAMVFQEPAGAAIRDRLEGAVVFVPGLLKYELANTAWKKIRRHPEDAAKILTALAVALDDRWGLCWQDADPVDVALVAHATGVTAYDATYLWLAGSLGADLVTLDEQVVAASAALAA